MHRSSTFNLLVAGASLASMAICQSSSDGSASMTIELQRGGVDVSTGTAPSAELSTIIDTSTVFVSPTDVIASTAPDSTVIVTVTSSSASSQISRDASDYEAYENSPWRQMVNHVVYTCYSSDRKSVDWNAPCPAVQAIQAQCTWGPEGLDYMKRVFLTGQSANIPETWLPQPPDVQQACYCSSQYADVVLGCGDCMVAHGAGEVFALLNLVTSNSTAMGEWSKLYCGADSKPEETSFQSAVYQAFGLTDEVPSTMESSTTATSSTSTLSDPLNNATEISLYYTAVVTSAYVVALPTASSSANQSHPNPWFTYSNLKTSDGLIVPTAVAARSTASGSTSDSDAASGSGTTTAAAGAIQTAMVQSGLGMGAFGIAVLAWAL